MDLICYAAPGYPDRTTFLARLHLAAPVDRLVMFQTIEELHSGLLRPMGDVLAVVLFPTDAPDLSRLLALEDLMTGARIILVLPQWDPRLVSEAHVLRPRFVTTQDQDFSEVEAVLCKMASKSTVPRTQRFWTSGSRCFWEMDWALGMISKVEDRKKPRRELGCSKT